MTSPDIIEAWTSNNSSEASTSKDSNAEEEAVTSSKNEEDYMFDPELLKSLDMSHSEATFNPVISIDNPGEGLVLRPLQQGDYRTGFLQLLGQLTTVGEVSEEQWQSRFAIMRKKTGTYHVMVLEDTFSKQVIGAATLVVEEKFIHGCSQVGRVEDVVVSDQYRGRQLGKFLVSVSVLLASKLHCYKVTLNCKDNMVRFYNSVGFKCEDGDANFMVIRL